MQEVLRQIRIRLRLAMNGVVSTSMREKGLQYKLNFGVSVPKLKEIAKDFPHEEELAEELWRQDVREMKILATLLQPVEGFTPARAEQWATEAPNQEIMELYAMNLLQHVAFARELAAEWIKREEEQLATLGYLLYARLFMKGKVLARENGKVFLWQVKLALEAGTGAVQRAALLALKQFGRQSDGQAKQVLDCLADFRSSGSPEKEMWYEELKFEFDYYR